MSGPSELHLVGSLIRALSHKVRGDLSLVMSDLSYLGTVLAPAEVERSKSRCREITAVLAKLSKVRSGVLELAETPVLSIVEQIGREVTTMPLQSTRVLVDREKLLISLAAAIDLIEAKTGERARCACELNEHEFRLHISCEGNFEPPSFFSCFTDFAEQQLGERFVFDGFIADVILRAHAVTSEICAASSSAKARISFPVR